MTKAQQKTQSVERNRQMIEHAWKVGQDYGVDIFSHSFRAWEDVAKFLNQNYPGEKTWTADSVRLLSYWYTADDGVVVRRPRKARGTGTVAVNRMKSRIACKLKAHDPVFENVATTVLRHYKASGSPKVVVELLNLDTTALMSAYRKQRGAWNEDKVDKIIRRCKRQRPDLFTRIVGEPAIIRKNKKSTPVQQGFALGDSATNAAAFVPAATEQPVLRPTLRPVQVRDYIDTPLMAMARAGLTPRKPDVTTAKPKTTRVHIQHDGDVLQVIQTPQKRLIISAKATEASGGKLVAAVAKLCQELGVDVSKW
jgi:hypothetical protein